MKILTAQQTRDLDAYTIAHEPIASIDLMERACTVFTTWFTNQIPNKDIPIQIVCGMGNNGGDGLAIARLLFRERYSVKVIICRLSSQGSEDFLINEKRLQNIPEIEVSYLQKGAAFPIFPEHSIIIDAVFGSGLNRPVEGYWAEWFDYINQQNVTVVSVDIPSGLFADQPTSGATIQADFTFTFELPKHAFLFPEHQHIVGHWTFRSIGLSKAFQEQVKSNKHYLEAAMIKNIFRKRGKFDHKGTFGHALLIAGGYGKAGAAILSARAALRSGLGLLTIHAPRSNYEILQISVPEAMVSIDRHRHYISQWPALEKYQVIGMGPGIDQRKTTVDAVLDLVENAPFPLVIDADALNILAKHPAYLSKLPKHSILTPHPKEFERLFGSTANSFERNALQIQLAKKFNIIIVLKGAHTCIALPDGSCYYNSTGNPGMATGGSGDVLTGIITGLMAQQYTAKEAALLGVYLHGLAGDIASEKLEHHSLIASDLINHLGQAFMRVQNEQL